MAFLPAWRNHVEFAKIGHAPCQCQPWFVALSTIKVGLRRVFGWSHTNPQVLQWDTYKPPETQGDAWFLCTCCFSLFRAASVAFVVCVCVCLSPPWRVQLCVGLLSFISTCLLLCCLWVYLNGYLQHDGPNLSYRHCLLVSSCFCRLLFGSYTTYLDYLHISFTYVHLISIWLSSYRKLSLLST